MWKIHAFYKKIITTELNYTYLQYLNIKTIKVYNKNN